jgi:hypothetical protein
MHKDTYKKIFAPDSGSLQEITVLDTDVSDWKVALDFLSTNYSVFFSENGIHTSLPDFPSIWEKRAEASILLEVMLPGFTLNCHFHDADRIQLDVLPENVNSREKAETVFHVMVGLAAILRKEVFLTPEFGSATNEQLRSLAVCSVDSISHLIESRLD